jgi:glycine betaine catabolism B
VIRRALIGGFTAALVLIALRAGAITAEEHASHHPGGGAAGAPGVPAMAASAPGMTSGGMGAMMGAPPAPPSAPGMAPGAPMGASAVPPGAPGAPGMAGGGMGAMMSEVMGKMMAPPAAGGCVGENCGSGAAKTPIYPSLMTLPALTPEKRAEIDALASQQISEGMGRLAIGDESLHRAARVGDNAAMQQSVGLMREGLDELGAGIAARRVLSEGKAPRNLALDWFKREMNLASPIAPEEPRALLGVPPFHLFTMVLLISFALAMVAMYFFKMRRAAALFGRLGPDANAPPPGPAPPLAGAPGPPAPAGPPTAGAHAG